jgi:hypothetical protein
VTAPPDAVCSGALEDDVVGAELGATLGAVEGTVVAAPPEQAPRAIVASSASPPSRFGRLVDKSGSSHTPRGLDAQPDLGSVVSVCP